MPQLSQILTQALSKNNLTLNAACQQKLITYLALLRKWNKAFNLTAITEPREMVYLHLIDSLVISPYLHGTNMLDVGSGAGLPGIPLAIMNPQQQWTVLDKNSKKTRFLLQTVAELALKNVAVVHGRSEDFRPSQCFDSILSRAFGTLAMFIETTEHLLCPHGRLIAMKGKYPQEELAELPDHFVAQQTIRLGVQGVDIERHVVCLEQKES